MSKLIVPFPSSHPPRSHEVWIGPNALNQLPRWPSLKSASQIFIFSDSRLKRQASNLSRQLKGKGFLTHVISLQVSEELKNFHRLYPIYGNLIKKGADRHSILIALGGGVIGDAIGFIAGTFMRGVRWVGVPSTLLAQIDSSLGGKTGVNHEQGKNLIGLIHQPSLVVCDLSFLNTLPDRDWISGLGEMIKYGLIFDPKLFWEVMKNWKAYSQKKSLKSLEASIRSCLQWKAQVVAQDEKDELGVREVLNFGHTFGHALESESRYGFFRHGEAVLYGMRLACLLSVKRGYLSARTQAQIDACLSEIPIPPLPHGISPMKYFKRIQLDKKAYQKKVRFVLLKDIGKTVLDRNVTEEEILSAVRELMEARETSGFSPGLMENVR